MSSSSSSSPKGYSQILSSTLLPLNQVCFYHTLLKGVRQQKNLFQASSFLPRPACLRKSGFVSPFFKGRFRGISNSFLRKKACPCFLAPGENLLRLSRPLHFVPSPQGGALLQHNEPQYNLTRYRDMRILRKRS